MTTITETSRLLDLLTQLRREADDIERELKERLAVVHGRIGAVETTIALLTNEQYSQASLWQKQPLEDVKRLPSPDIVKGAKTQKEALQLLAQWDNEHHVNATEAARILTRAGHVKGSFRNAVSHLYNLMKGNPQEWEWIEPGTFKLLDNA